MTEMNSSPSGTAQLERPAYPYGWQPPLPPPAPPAGPAGPFGTPGTPRGPRRSAMMAAVVALVLAGGVTGGVTVAAWDRATGTAATTTAATAPAATVDADTTLSGVAARLAPSVVTIKVSGQDGADLGSGVVLSTDGLIVTNAHVVSSGDTSPGRVSSGGTITVTLSDGTTLPATLVGASTSADLAVLRVSGARNLTPATLGDSDALQVGDTVLAFGSPLGLSGSVTSGIVSALHRDTASDSGGGAQRTSLGSGTAGDMIQTDAAINAGNSGGPLVDTAGRVVGIDTAIATTGQDSGNIGVGFAIPVNTVRTVVERLIQNG
ncbi:S1C family serine protease [Rhizomonospora bruguierae]|uniref:S1C family serine protease n=1 Tax=Rhizomonospora bruguierae TaxID=1581705 RepID=UPI001BD057FA|nr:trypsin-like peptidase domain-containing protein [Micromonospora sp. NBRC 107566]